MRAQLRHLKLPQLVSSAAAFRLRNQPPTTPTAAAKLALKSIARRYQQLSAEIAVLDQHLDQLVAAAAPALLARKGVGTDIASTLLTIAGDNPERSPARVPSPTCPGRRRSRPCPARSPAIASTVVVTAREIERCTC
jgi:hypothetical protein